MGYKIQNFEDDKTVLKAEHLINIENAILDLEKKSSSNSGSISNTASFKQVANPIDVSELNGKKIVCFGDSITQGTPLGNPTTEKATDANGQIYPAITDEELAASIPVATRSASYPVYLSKLGVSLSVDNLGTSGWCLPTGYTLQSKINGYNGDTPTTTKNIHTLKSHYPEDPYAIFIMFGVNEYTRHYPLGRESNLYENYVENKLSTYDLTYIRYKKDPKSYVDGDGNTVATYNAEFDMFEGITDSYIDDENKKIYVLTDTIYGAWEYVALRLKKDFVKSKIIFMTPYLWRGIITVGGHKNFITEPNKEGYLFSDMMDVIISTGLKYKIPVLDNFYHGGVNLENAWQYIGDSCHLNYRGAISIAKNILEFLTLNPVVLNPKWLQPGGSANLGSGGEGGDTPDNVVNVTGVTLDKTVLNLMVGDVYKLTHTVIPDNATNKAVSWMSSDDTVAVVNNGVVTAKSKGTAVITCLTDDAGMNITCDVYVEENNLIKEEKTIQEIYDSLKLYNAEGQGIANTISASTATNESEFIQYIGNAQDKCLFSELPLYQGSEVDLTIIPGSNSNPNYTIGFDSNIELENWAAKNWKADNTGAIIPESHMWLIAKEGNDVSYLERQTGKFIATAPKVSAETIHGNGYRYKLKVLRNGFEVYSNNELVFTMTKEASNPYIAHKLTPVYFCFATSTGVGIQIHSISQVKQGE